MNRVKFIKKESETKPSRGCPKCGQEQNCPCAACKRRGFTKPDDIVWVWQPDRESIACGKCGLVLHVDEWEDLEYEYIKAMGGFKKYVEDYHE